MTYAEFTREHWRKIRTDSPIESEICAIRRDTRAMGNFPSREPHVRLVTAYLIGYLEEWSVSRSYLRAGLMERARVLLGLAAYLAVSMASQN